MLGVVVLLLTLTLSTALAHAQKRVAMVVGNSEYQHTPKLTNSKNDATDMAAALKKLGFEVIVGLDLNKADFERKVLSFSMALQGAESGIFFYAGHGLQVAGQNYLVPVDAKAETAAALDFEMLKLDLVHRTMERATNTNILFLDACRDNPLARNLARAMGTRSAEIGRGLAAVESGIGTLISFSTQPGNVALDGTGRNSPFAGALVKQLLSTNDDLSAILIAVRNDVMRETHRKQVPWEHSALTGQFHFTPVARAAEPAKAVLARPPSDAAEAWAAVKDTNSIAVLEAFIARYHGTFYADFARARAQDLKRAAEATAQASREAFERQTRKEAEAQSRAEAQRADDQRRSEEARRATDRLAAAKPAEPPAQVASLPAGTAPFSAQHPPGDGKALTRSLQTELKRVGCDPGPVDGDWRPKAKEALRSFAHKTKQPIEPDTPTPAALAAVAAQKGQVCRPTCSPTETEQNGKCIAKVRDQPRKPKAADQPPKAAAGDGKVCFSSGSGFSYVVPCPR